MRIANRRLSIGTVICIIVTLLAAAYATPRPLLAQDTSSALLFDTAGPQHSPLEPDGTSLALGSPSPARSFVCCAFSHSSSHPSAASNQTPTFGRIFKINNTSTWADAILPTKDGYLVIADYAVQNDFALNLTEFSLDGRPIHSRNLSITPSLANTARVTGDGGVLIGAYTDMSSPREGLLLRLNAGLDVQWAKIFRSDGPASVEGVMETADGGVIALVRDSWRIAVVKLDAGGNVVWKNAILPRVGSTTHSGDAYDIYENAYLDAAGRKQCGGYIVYGVVQRPATDWDLYLAALSCDGKTLLWQRIVSGPSWEASQPTRPNEWFPRSTNLTVVEDRNGLNSQDVDLLLAATTGSYGKGEAILFVPFTVSGGKQLSAAPVFSQTKILDGPDAERLVGPFGGPNLIRLSDGSPLLAGSIRSLSSGKIHALLVKMRPNLSVLWQYSYSLEEMLSLYEEEGASAILAAGGGPAGLMLNLGADGSGGGVCVGRSVTDLKVSDVSPDIVTPAYPLGDGGLQIAKVSVTTTEATASLICPLFHYAPALMSDR